MTAETLSRQIKDVTPCLKRVALPTKSMVNGSRDFSKRSLDVPKMLYLSSKTYCCSDNNSDKIKLSSKCLSN